MRMFKEELRAIRVNEIVGELTLNAYMRMFIEKLNEQMRMFMEELRAMRLCEMLENIP
jgi:hypothetical protein